jgi:hypothetical protein
LIIIYQFGELKVSICDADTSNQSQVNMKWFLGDYVPKLYKVSRHKNQKNILMRYFYKSIKMLLY